jgi:hypothetical protein
MVAPISAAELVQMEPKLILPARFTLQAKTLATQLFHKESLPDKKGRVLNQPKYGEFEAFDATEGIEVDNPQKLSTSNWVVEPTEIVAQFLLTDVAARVGGENHLANAGRILGDAMAKKVDKKGLSIFKDGDSKGNLFGVTHSLGTVGGTGSPTTTITVPHVNAAVARLEGNAEPTPKPIRMILRAEQMRKLLNAVAPVSGTNAIYGGISEEVLKQYLKHDFRLFGLEGGFITPNLDRFSTTSTPVIGDANTYAVGAVFSPESIWYVPVDSMTVEKERRMKARSWLYQASHTFGFGVYQEKWGVKMSFEAADPTS